MKTHNQNILKKEYLEYVESLLDASFERALKSSTVFPQSLDDSMFITIWNFIQSRRVRRRNYMTENEKKELQNAFISYAKRQYHKKLPITFYIFDLPIKTGVAEQVIDSGEEIMLRNFENLARRIELVYPYGVHFNILSDGNIFSTGGIMSQQNVEEYFDNVTKLIDELSLTRVSIIDWYMLVFKNKKAMYDAFTHFKNTESYRMYLLKEIEDKTRIRCREIAGNNYTPHLEEQLLYARAFFEKSKKDYLENNLEFELGFKLTKGGFRRDEPTLAIYPADPNIETSVSRGITTFVKKQSGIVVPVLITKTACA